MGLFYFAFFKFFVDKSFPRIYYDSNIKDKLSNDKESKR